MTSDDIAALIAARAPESLTLEFKRDLPGRRDQDTKEFARDVCALANANGGTILYGIVEKSGCAEEVVGVPTDDLDGEILRLTGVLRTGIEPRSLRFSFEQTDIGGRRVLSLAIQQSFNRPHWVVASGDQKFYVRHNSGKAPMSLDEIRDAFLSNATILERSLTWRTERLAVVTKDTSLDHSNIWAVLHLVPLNSLSASAPRFDPQTQFASGEHQLRTPMDAGSGNPNYLGWRYETRAHDRTLFEYYQIYRDFRVELAFRAGERSDKHNVLRLHHGVLESDVGRWLARFQKWAAHFDYPFPAFGFLSLLNTRGSTIISDYRNYQTDEPALLLEPVIVENIEFEPISLFLPAYNHLYQSFGFASCPYFDDQGKWKSGVRI